VARSSTFRYYLDLALDIGTLLLGGFLIFTANDHLPTEQGIAAGFILFIAFYKTRETVAKRRNAKEEDVKKSLLFGCKEVVSHLATCPGIDVNGITAGVWICGPKCCGEDRFGEAAVFHLPPYSIDHGIPLCRDKGIAGRTWRDNAPNEQDFTRDISPVNKWSLDRRDLEAIREHNYTGVWAIPLRKDNQVIAVFVLEYAGPPCFAAIQSELNGQVIKRLILGGCREELCSIDEPHKMQVETV
jgi:hypothetical protein